MKRYCKKVDLTDRNFIYRAVADCLYGGMGKHKKPKFSRRDTLKLFAEYSDMSMESLRAIAKSKQYYKFDWIIDKIVDGIVEEIKTKKYVVKPIWYTEKVDKCSGKIRCVGIQDIKQQLYDYIAVYALEEVLRKKIGFYQCSAIPKKGQVMGARAIKRWTRNKEMRYVWQCDIYHFYESIDREVLLEKLGKCVKNDAIMHLVRFLINTFDRGLAIGSFLSQYLANFYLSFAYHFVNEQLFKIRRKKDGTLARVKLVHHSLFYMDDIMLMGKRLADVKMAAKRLMDFLATELHVKIKNDWKLIDLQTGYVDMMGFKISRKAMTIRSRIFLKSRDIAVEITRAARTGAKITQKVAKTMTSLYGWTKNSDSKHFCKRYHVDIAMIAAKNVIGGINNHAKNEIRYAAA